MSKGLVRAALLAGMVLASVSMPGLAALPPIHDRVEQFGAVLATPGLAEMLSPHGLIDRIERAGDLTFRVSAGECFVVVHLTAVPPAEGMVGPTRYEGKLGAVACN